MITDCVFDETVTVLRFQSGRHDVAAAAGRVLRGSEGVRLVPVGPPAFEEAWTLFLERPDKRWSFADCTSFVVMEDLDIRKAASFDRNFAEAGFAVLP